MPIKPKQTHIANAPQPVFDALVSLRHKENHIKALSAYYNNIVAEGFPSPSLVGSLADQIVVAQRRFLSARRKLQSVSRKTGYHPDPGRTTMNPVPEGTPAPGRRRRYHYENDEGVGVQLKVDQDRAAQQCDEQERLVSADTNKSININIALKVDTRVKSDINVNLNIDSDSVNSSDSFGTRTFNFTFSPGTGQNSVSTSLTASPAPSQRPKKKVRFATLPADRDGLRKELSRRNTRAQIEEDFRIANRVLEREWVYSCSEGAATAKKRRCTEEHYEEFDWRPRKQAKMDHD